MIPAPVVRRVTVSAAALLLGLGAASARDRSEEAAGTFLPFINAVEPGQSRTSPPKLHVVFGRQRLSAVMDTGSTGLVVAARAIPHWEQLPSLGPARLTYSSSGRVMEGRWVVTPVTVAGRNGARVRTARMPVMAVTRVACLKDARDCTPEEHPRHVAMLGIGHAREADLQAQSTPDRNPFLRTEAEASGRVQRGYVVTRDGVYVGLSRAMPDPAFLTVQLKRDERFGDWSAPPVCLSVDSRMPPACGTVLVDTGVTGSFLTAGGGQLEDLVAGSTLRPGTQVGVQLSRGNEPPWGYTFRVDDRSNPLTPDKVTVVHKDGPAFLNTSVHFLNGFDVLFDAEQGLAGYRARR